MPDFFPQIHRFAIHKAAGVIPAAFSFIACRIDGVPRIASLCRRMMDVVCGVITDRKGRILACRRPAGKHLGGLWEFPGGKIDPGESPAAALVRELREELSIEVEVGAALQPVVWAYDAVTIRLIPYRCRILAGDLHPVEHDEIRWCHPDGVGDLDWAPADVPILAELDAIAEQTVD